MIFPELIRKPCGYLDLNKEAIRYLNKRHFFSKKRAKNPLLDPAICEMMVLRLHEELGVSFSYGGWLENRSTLWNGSYLDAERKYLHLGVDLNALPHTRVQLDFEAEILRIDDDYPEQHGWGKRVIVRETMSQTVVIFAHLEQVFSPELSPGHIFEPGIVIGRIADSGSNGGWYPHLHVQAVAPQAYERLLKHNLRGLDGYGKSKDRAKLARDFPDPMRFIQLT